MIDATRDFLLQILRRPERVKRRILAVDSKIVESRAEMLPGGLSYNDDRVQGFQASDKLEKYADAVLYLWSERKKLVAEYEDAVGEVMKLTERLPDRQRRALRMRHLQGKSNGEIAEEMGASKRWVQKLCKEAYENLAKTFNQTA